MYRQIFMQTRTTSLTSVVGQPSKLPHTQLPTGADVYHAYLHETKNMKPKATSMHEVSNFLANELRQIYGNASIPTIQMGSIIQRIKKLVTKCQSLCKYSNCDRNSSNFIKQLDELESLFNICPCKCVNQDIRDRSNCSCQLRNKVPMMEWKFWVDQNTVRQMVIGNIDMETTRKLTKRIKRSTTNSDIHPKASKIFKQNDELPEDEVWNNDFDNHSVDEMSEENITSYDSDTDDNDVSNRNTIQYPELCKAADRCNISTRDACLIVNAALKDLGLLTYSNTICHTKLWSQRKSMREKIILQHGLEMKNLTCIGFDGKCDTILTKKDNIRRTAKEEYYVIVAFPQCKYVDHVCVDSNKAENVADKVLSVIRQTGSMNCLSAMLCDGTPTNTGYIGGIIRSDQLYLLKASLVVQNGYSNVDDTNFFQIAMPGVLNNAR